MDLAGPEVGTGTVHCLKSLYAVLQLIDLKDLNFVLTFASWGETRPPHRNLNSQKNAEV